jgi:hypothetical protein
MDKLQTIFSSFATFAFNLIVLASGGSRSQILLKLTSLMDAAEFAT